MYQTLQNLGILCNQIGDILEKQGQECISCSKKPNNGVKRKWSCNEQTRQDKDGKSSELQSSVPSSSTNVNPSTNIQVATYTVQTVNKQEEQGAFMSALVETESEATDNETVIWSQQSRQSSSFGDTNRSNTPKKTATRWRKGTDDEKLIQVVKQCLENQTATTKSHIIQVAMESFGNVYSLKQVRNHYTRLHKENKMPDKAPI